jgi:PleD family two-component response regulator
MSNSSTGEFFILLADDDEDDVEFFREALKKTNHFSNLHALSDGKEALDFLSSSERIPDCIFLDLNMPRVSGLECLMKIRSNEVYKNVPVIIYSTSNNMREIDNAIECGATLYIVKTFSLVVLIRKLNLILSDMKKLAQNKIDREKFVI